MNRIDFDWKMEQEGLLLIFLILDTCVVVVGIEHIITLYGGWYEYAVDLQEVVLIQVCRSTSTQVHSALAFQYFISNDYSTLFFSVFGFWRCTVCRTSNYVALRFRQFR